MFERLLKLIENAYAPYSKFLVAAIIVYEDGGEFEGVNVENSSFGATNCAERSAIFSAISKGYKNKKIKEVHIFARNDNESEIENLSPCGICRQVISEFSDEMSEIIIWKTKEKFERVKFNELLPLSFKGGTLGKR